MKNFILFANQVSDFLSQSNIRVSIDNRNEKLVKIRDAEMKIPYMAIIGEKK